MRETEEIARAEGQTKSELARDALRRQIELSRLRGLRRYARRRAEAGSAAFGRRALAAEAALDRTPEPLPPALRVERPWPQLERRQVADVPMTAAGELGDPVAVPVLAVADDRALHH